MNSKLEMIIASVLLISLVAAMAAMQHFPKFRARLHGLVMGITTLLSAYLVWNVMLVVRAFFARIRPD